MMKRERGVDQAFYTQPQVLHLKTRSVMISSTSTVLGREYDGHEVDRLYFWHSNLGAGHLYALRSRDG
jgi:hypothetical protein